jgi:prefoldin subunit 5
MLSELQTAVQKAEDEHKNEVSNLAAQKTILESQIEVITSSLTLILFKT